MENPKFQIESDENGLYQFRLIDEHGKTLFSSTSHHSWDECAKAISQLRRVIAVSPIEGFQLSK